MNVKILTPTVPNFVSIKLVTRGQRQDGFQESPKVQVGDLTDEQLEALAKDWKDKLFKNAERQRKANAEQTFRNHD